MGFEEYEAPMPFVGEVSLSPSVLVPFVALLIVGMTIYALAQDIGQHLADRLNTLIGNIIGTNPATGENAGDGPALGGE
jgi:hypothetical protein